ncbi:hypothetical protein TRFO_40017 [Tritrichomonas foetus]|uniref:Uncharacterized protein n=1 Tax=Tritrichomonas foetus TaxID=1144522 RepID=A0A1J4J8I4_9EUKA|nr:hypothetical protein TRFO_40017 [Tritrichomonas foetus]|eukprot:OHS93709.1 hypothetical protein TRFO_40017 [Tritrichomonas foetus]
MFSVDSSTIEEFTQAAQEDIDLFEGILSITEQKYDEIKSKISNSKYVSDKPNFRTLLTFIGTAPNIRPASILLFCRLISDFLSLIQKFFTTIELVHIIKNKRMILVLIDSEIFTANNFYSKCRNDVGFFLYFFEDFKVLNQSLFSSMERYNPYVKEFLANVDLDEHRKLRREGLNHSAIAAAIRDDDIEKFKAIFVEIEAKNNQNCESNSISDSNLSKNNLNSIIESSNSKNILPSQNSIKNIYDQLIEFSIYEATSAINTRNNMPSLVEYAAFYGSVKIFFYLVREKSVTYKNLTNFTRFASCGGNMEILNFCVSEKLLFNDSCRKGAVEFHRFEAANLICPNPGFYHICWSLRHTNYKYFMSHVNDFLQSCENERETEISDLFTFIYQNCPVYFVTFFLKAKILGDSINDVFLFPSLASSLNFDVIQTAIKFLPKEIANINLNDRIGFNSLHYACMGNSPEIVRFLLQQNDCDPNSYSTEKSTNLGNYQMSALQLAAKRGFTEIVKILLENEKTDINFIRMTNNETALMIAAQNDKYEVVKILLENEKIDVNIENYNGQNALHYAILGNSLESVKQLIFSSTIDINKKDKNGLTPFVLAAEKPECLEIVKFFCSLLNTNEISGNYGMIQNNEIDFQTKDNFGVFSFVFYQTALLVASRNCNLEMMKVLLDSKKFDINDKDNKGVLLKSFYTAPIHHASAIGNLEALKFLSNYENVNCEIQDDFGWTPLHYAAQNNKSEAAKYLIETCKVNINVKDKENRAPLAWALQYGYKSVISVIRSFK